MIPKIPFGSTGHHSSRLLFGAAALWDFDPATADKTLDLLLKYGINHIDTAASYGDAELNIARWMPHHRNRFFLATKTAERTYQAAYDEIQRSLERLQVDRVDLLQLHNLVDPQEWETAFGPEGALAAAIAAKEKGYVRFIGVTGHGMSVPDRHIRSLERYPFDSVLLPLNYNFMQDDAYRADFTRLRALCADRGVAVQTIKSIALGRWGEHERNRNTWYRPLENPQEIETAVHFVLSQPGLFLNTVGDLDLLPLVLEAGARFTNATPALPALESALAQANLSPLFAEGEDI